MDKKELKQKAMQAIDNHKDELIALRNEIYGYHELGYKEVESDRAAVDFMQKLGLQPESELAVTGSRGRCQGKSAGPSIAVMGELDSIITNGHPDAGENGSVHACGHDIQVAGMLGAAVGIIKSGAMNHLSGSIDFMTVPAEEYVEIGYRKELRDQGKIRYFGGKQEYVHRGIFDDTDMALMFHAANCEGRGKAILGGKSNGFVGKMINFIGKEAHAGAAPEKGVNALNAAAIAQLAIQAQRETFVEKDNIRVHPIISKGGDMVNVVPADVRMETYVRGSNVAGIIDANKKVTRALKAGALAVGATVQIDDLPGYLPMTVNQPLYRLLKDNLLALGVNENEIIEKEASGGSTDFSDLTYLMPAIHPYFGGISGNAHGRDYRMEDADNAIILPAKAFAALLIDLLYDDAGAAKKILAEFEPQYSKEKYLELMESFGKSETFSG